MRKHNVCLQGGTAWTVHTAELAECLPSTCLRFESQRCGKTGHMPVNTAFRKWRKGEQKLKVRLTFIISYKMRWDTGDQISKKEGKH